MDQNRIHRVLGQQPPDVLELRGYLVEEQMLEVEPQPGEPLQLRAAGKAAAAVQTRKRAGGMAELLFKN